MARHDHLPIYKQSYELLNQIMHVSKDFPREHKFTIGQKLREEVIQILVLIYRANSQKDKSIIVVEILEKILVSELLIRLCRDMKILSVKHFAALVLLTQSLSKQAEGWKKSSSKL